MKAWVLLPAYNEGSSLGVLLEGLKREGLATIVVDDGSKDNTFEVARSLAAIVLRNTSNLGKGYAIRKGIEYLLQNEDFDYLIFMDSDGQHSLADVKKFLERAYGCADFVVGNRMSDPAGMPVIRIWTNKLMSGIISLMTGVQVNDSQCGFRMIRRSFLEKMPLVSCNFEIESELLVKAAKLGAHIENMPVRTIYLKSAKSNINPVIDGWRFLKFIYYAGRVKV